jgi:hypothetical protein
MSQATVFNDSVATIASVEASSTPRSVIMSNLLDAAAGNNVVITRITFQSDSAPISVSGQAQSEDAILAFKSSIEQIPNFGPVDLPLDGVQGSGTSYSFSMTLSEKGSATSSASH